MPTFYIAPSGDDANDGCHPDTVGGSRGPFATLSRARDAVRQARAGAPDASFAVELRGGWYFLNEPFVLSPEDSGTATNPLVYRAYAGEAPILSGGHRITGFRPTAVNGGEGWYADLDREMRFTQLFVNGQRMQRTRLPASGRYRIEHCETLDNPLDWEGRITRFGYREGDINPLWSNLTDTEVIVSKLWFESHTKIASVDPEAREVELDSYLIAGGHNEGGETATFWIENVFEALREPGQFYLDVPGNRLYFIPRWGDKPDNAFVVAPHLERLVHFKGDPFGDKVRHVHLEGLHFRHSEYAYPPGSPGSVQAAFTLPGAIILDGAEDCTFLRCEVSQIAQYAIEFRLGCTRNKLLACHLHDLGGGGVKINHDRGFDTPAHEDAVRLPIDPAAGVIVPKGRDASRLPRQKVTVSDCRIHDGGKIFLSAVGIWIGDSAGNRIRHNEIYRMNYSGISCGWSWVYEFGMVAADNLIEGNHIHHLNPGKELSDLAGIYTLGCNPGSVLRGNLVHDVDTEVYGNWGIYHDGSSSFYYDEGNAAFRCGYGAFFNNAGRHNVLRRNILLSADSPDNPAVVIGNDSGMLTVTMEENILASRQGPQVLLQEGYQGHARFRRNLYLNEFGHFGFAGRHFENAMLSLDEWVTQGIGNDESQSTALVSGGEDGFIAFPADAPWLDNEWRRVLKMLRSTGPRAWSTLISAVADWPDAPAEPAPAILPELTLDQPMFTDDTRTYYVPRFEVPAGVPTQGALTLTNRGEMHAHGKVRFDPEHTGALTVAAKRMNFDLAPGESHTIPFEVTLAAGVEQALLYASLAEGSGFAPLGMFLYPGP